MNGATNNLSGKKLLKEARKLQELFKGRFSEDEALHLIRIKGGLFEAADYLNRGDPAEVRQFLYRQIDANERKKLENAQDRDAKYVSETLQHGIPAGVRLFACQDDDKYWWRKVPARKEVSKCKMCQEKYDPVPREEEWGIAEYKCICLKAFLGFGWMNHSHRRCFDCGEYVAPDRIIPPSKDRFINRQHNCQSQVRIRSTSRQVNYIQDPPLLMVGTRVLCPSQKHDSTGSTVATFMSQGDLMETYDVVDCLESVTEEDGSD